MQMLFWNPNPPSPIRRFLSFGLGIITLLCTTSFWIALAFMTAQLYAGVYEGPELGVVVLFLTLPIAVICTVSAMLLAGSNYSKLAWVSFSLYTLPLKMAFSLGVCYEISARIYGKSP